MPADSCGAFEMSLLRKWQVVPQLVAYGGKLCDLWPILAARTWFLPGFDLFQLWTYGADTGGRLSDPAVSWRGFESSASGGQFDFLRTISYLVSSLRT
jgi:hypothetical protein